MIEFGNYIFGRITCEQYIIREVAKIKHLKLELKESQIVQNNSSH